MLEEIDLKVFLVNTSTSGHDPDGSPDITTRKYMIGRMGEGNVDWRLPMDVKKVGSMRENGLEIHTRQESSLSREKKICQKGLRFR